MTSLSGKVTRERLIRLLYKPGPFLLLRLVTQHSHFLKAQTIAFRLPAHLYRANSNGQSMDHSTYRPTMLSCGTKPCMSYLHVLISVPRSPDLTYSRIPRPRCPNKYTYVPTKRRSYHPELLLCTVFWCAADSSSSTDLVSRCKCLCNDDTVPTTDRVFI